MKNTLLIAEDDETISGLLKKAFSRPDIDLHLARGGAEAIRILDRQKVDVILTDVRMPGADGLQVLEHGRKSNPDCEVILMTGFASVEEAVQAMRLGAFHYVTKPFAIEEVVRLVDRVLDLSRVRRENVQLKSQARDHWALTNIIGVSEPIRNVISMIRKVADTDSTVLITGESGTGKELVARALHYLSPRAEQMLVPINCSAIPAELLESELFGHVKGAFTGAHMARTGRFEMAHNGTLFLDEIGEMSPHLQSKLLRVLQEKSFTPVGGNKPVLVDVRVIAATNKDLDEAMRKGEFREDLFYRLNVIPLRIPPLRERPEDIPLLVEHFLREVGHDGPVEALISPAAMKQLMGHHWPGNVRELRNLIEATVAMGETPQLDGVDGGGRPEADALDGLPYKEARARVLADFEQRYLRALIERARGNVSQAAREARMDRTH
ncbi:MAG TPA: sigma-54 dependent transcriptional regulator, partial [Candidatus Deferrimicrobiaceae bacterium]